MNPNKKAEKLIHKHLDRIYKTCRSVTVSWRDEVISMGVLKFVVDNSRLKDSGLPEEFVKNFNEMLDQLVITCRKQAVGNTISFRYLKSNIKVMKKNVSEGMK